MGAGAACVILFGALREIYEKSLLLVSPILIIHAFWGAMRMNVYLPKCEFDPAAFACIACAFCFSMCVPSRWWLNALCFSFGTYLYNTGMKARYQEDFNELLGICMWNVCVA